MNNRNLNWMVDTATMMLNRSRKCAQCTGRTLLHQTLLGTFHMELGSSRDFPSGGRAFKELGPFRDFPGRIRLHKTLLGSFQVELGSSMNFLSRITAFPGTFCMKLEPSRNFTGRISAI